MGSHTQEMFQARIFRGPRVLAHVIVKKDYPGSSSIRCLLGNLEGWKEQKRCKPGHETPNVIDKTKGAQGCMRVQEQLRCISQGLINLKESSDAFLAAVCRAQPGAICKPGMESWQQIEEN
jgi:hypothetical protein